MLTDRSKYGASKCNAFGFKYKFGNCKVYGFKYKFGIILAIGQLNAQILVIFNKFIIYLYMFRALLCSSSGGQIVLYSIWYRHTL